MKRMAMLVGLVGLALFPLPACPSAEPARNCPFEPGTYTAQLAELSNVVDPNGVLDNVLPAGVYEGQRVDVLSIGDDGCPDWQIGDTYAETYGFGSATYVVVDVQVTENGVTMYYDITGQLDFGGGLATAVAGEGTQTIVAQPDGTIATYIREEVTTDPNSPLGLVAISFEAAGVYVRAS